MKTLSEMVEFVRRKLRDASENAPVWDDDEIRDEMESAWEQVRAELAENPSGQKTVAEWGDAQSLVADQELYDLPSDALMVLGAQARQGPTFDWFPVPYCKPPATAGPISGTAALLGFSQPAGIASGLAWFDDTDPGEIRIWPGRGAVSNDEYRLRYVPKIPFPSADSATLRDPDATGSDVYRLPDRLDAAVCYLTCSLLALEELENGAPIGAFGTMYSSTMNGILRSARILRPRTRYVGDR